MLVVVLLYCLLMRSSLYPTIHPIPTIHRREDRNERPTTSVAVCISVVSDLDSLRRSEKHTDFAKRRWPMLPR